MSHKQFDQSELSRRRALWKAIVEGYIQQAVGGNVASILDLGSGWGEFSHSIKAQQVFAVDMEVGFADFVRDVASFTVQDATRLAFASEAFDVVFASNLLEHIPTRTEMLAVLREVCRVLRHGGRFVIIGPNFKYAYRHYFDFFDHYCEYTDRSMVEALRLAGFEQFDRVVPRFLPFSTKQALPQHPALVRLYLRLPICWRILGQQFLIIAQK